MTIELTYWNRLEPRARANDLSFSLGAEVRDPLWFLARQWQVGEFAGEDGGSLAFTRYSGQVSRMPRWLPGDTELPLEREVPLERQTLREPFTPDLGLQVELGHDFADYLAEEVGSGSVTRELLQKFRDDPRFAVAKFGELDVLDPPDAASVRFLEVCAGRTVNGYELVRLGQGIAAGTDSVPASVATDPARIAQIEAALTKLLDRVGAVFGEIGPSDPVTWHADRLEYQLQVVGVNPDPAAGGHLTFSARPDSDGEFDWFSFDIEAKNATLPDEGPEGRAFSIIPARVRFPGMPASRFWAFEENTLALPDVSCTSPDDILKLLTSDYMTIHSNDWFVLPYEQEPGTLAWTDWVVVYDVFGRPTVVRIADSGQPDAGVRRWSMFRAADRSVEGIETLGNAFLLPQSSGAAMQLGSVLEDVRFGRDETANMAFGIERITTSPIGEPHSGRQRDAEVDEARKLPLTTATDSGFPLRYEIENELPASWVPFLPRQIDASNPSIELQRGAAEKATGTGTPRAVRPRSKILKPENAVESYFIKEEEIPRSGLRVERAVYRARWTDGSTHLWVQRRRHIGAGEAQSGLRFDRALPNEG